MKKELLILGVFALASILYGYVQPQESVETITPQKEIVVFVEGKVTQEITFTSSPTIQMVFEYLQIENIYHFENSTILENKQVFYIPETLENRISLNHASKEELMTLKGIGEKMAEKILSERENAPFKTIEDMQRVNGIGKKTYYRLREFLCI